MRNWRSGHGYDTALAPVIYRHSSPNCDSRRTQLVRLAARPPPGPGLNDHVMCMCDSFEKMNYLTHESKSYVVLLVEDVVKVVVGLLPVALVLIVAEWIHP